MHNFIRGARIGEMEWRRQVAFETNKELMLGLSAISRGLVFCCVLSLVLPPVPAQAPAPPDVPSSLLRDHHDGVTLSADPYSDPGRCKEKFGKANPYPVGILPVEIFLRNETDQPVKIDLSTVQMTVHFSEDAPQNVDWMTAEEVATAVAYPKGPKYPHASRLPVPIPSVGDKKVDNLVGIIRPLMFDSDVLPPRSLLHGFLFFDVNRNFSVVQKASLYVPDATVIPGNKALLFFEVPFSGGAPSR